MPRRPRKPVRSPRPSVPVETFAPLEPDESLSIQARILFALLIFCLAALMFGMTPFTYNLDDIKVSILFILFPIPLFLYFMFRAQGQAPSPPKSLNVALAAYIAVVLISTARAEYKWIAFYMTGFILAALGGYFGAVSCVRRRIDLERLILAFLVLCAGTILFGLLHRLKFFTFSDSVSLRRRRAIVPAH
jgi:hypothetical protein